MKKSLYRVLRWLALPGIRLGMKFSQLFTNWFFEHALEGVPKFVKAEFLAERLADSLPAVCNEFFRFCLHLPSPSAPDVPETYGPAAFPAVHKTSSRVLCL